MNKSIRNNLFWIFAKLFYVTIHKIFAKNLTNNFNIYYLLAKKTKTSLKIKGILTYKLHLIMIHPTSGLDFASNQTIACHCFTF